MAYNLVLLKMIRLSAAMLLSLASSIQKLLMMLLALSTRIFPP